MLQTIWAYKDLRNTLSKAGWNKSHFKVCVLLFAGQEHRVTVLNEQNDEFQE